MEPAPLSQVAAAAKQFARRLLSVGENRLELLIVEVEEARACLLHSILLALAVAVFGFLALLALNAAMVIWCWNDSPITMLLGMAGVYAVVAGGLYWWLARVLREWKLLSATLDQLRKDRACLDKNV